jgi:hypothetical protein
MTATETTLCERASNYNGENMNKKMPKTIYVKWESLANDEPFMVASEDWDTHGELGTKTRVGTYQLVETNYVISETKKVPAKRS